MPGLGSTIATLAAQRRQFERFLRAMPGAGTTRRDPSPNESRLVEVAFFGSNPGALRMFKYVPRDPVPALVVVLHGCTQTAAGYDIGAGWSTLADRYGFMLLLPEQTARNNPKTCFNWFRPGDITRGQGEARSIRQMIDKMVVDHAIDPRRVYVTGLSAGGAMTAVMLATYPEVFSAGAIIAGLPYGSATSVKQAFESMFRVRVKSPREWGDLVRAASSHRGPWPRVSVWHGGADSVVKPKNAEELLKQWTDVHGLDTHPDRTETVDGYPRQIWLDRNRLPVIESWMIPLMAHGTPLSAAGEDGHGVPGEYLIDVGISSSYHIVKFFGLADTRRVTRPRLRSPVTTPPSHGWEIVPEADAIPRNAGRDRRRTMDDSAGSASDRETRSQESHASGPGARPGGLGGFIEGTITRALEAAGLIKRR